MRKILAFFLSLSVLTLAACSSGAQGDASKPAGNEPVEQKITIAVSGDAATLDPHKSFNGFVFTATNQIYETLLYRAADGSLQPRLATEWKAVDETTWEFKLRNGVKFTDGTPFNAQAVKFNLERLKDPATKAPGAFIVGMVKEIKPVDETTVQIITEKPFAPLPAHLSHPVTAMVSPEAAKGDLGKQPVGTGPFTLQDWKAGDSITLAANAGYWGGKPKLETVILRVIPEAGTQLTELKAGTVDLISSIQPEKFDEIAGDKELTAVKFLGWGSLFLGYNTKAGPLAKPELRQAIAKAIDRKGIVESLRKGMAEEAVSILPRTIFGAASDLTDYSYDPDGAKALLQQAGIATPLKLKLNTFENAENKQIAGAIQAQLREVGIELELAVTDYSAFATEIAKPDHELYLSSWGTVTMDADYTLYSLLHSAQQGADNKSFYAQADVDEWLTQARATADSKLRQELYTKVQQKVQEDLPYLTLYYPLSSYAKNRRLQGEVYPFSSINLDLRQAEVR